MIKQPLPAHLEPTRTTERVRPVARRSWWSRSGQVLAAIAGLTLGAGLVSGGAAAADAPAERGQSVRALHRVEVIDLGCEGAQRNDVASVRCRWTVPTSIDVAGVRLVRVAVGSDLGRTTAFRTDDVSENSFVDSPVRVGVRYVYSVRAFDSNGRLVGASRSVSAGVRIEPPATVEVLRLDCAQISGIRVSCEWSDPIADGRALTLWRSVEAGVRERVASFSQPFPSAYVDGVPTGSTTVTYAVIVTDGDGDIVARSRADGLRLRTSETDAEPVDTRPAETLPPERSPSDTRPVETRPVETRPVETRPVETRPVETRPVETRPVETRPVETRPADTLPSDRSERSAD